MVLLANADDWEDIEMFAECHKDFLKRYIKLANGIPSHDTIQRVMGNINPQQIQGLYQKWNEMLSTNEGKKLKKNIHAYVLLIGYKLEFPQIAI